MHLNQLCEKRYALMLQDLKDCQQAGLTYTKEIERCFHICYAYWTQLRELVIHHHFEPIAEEIRFFKTLKPLFTSEMQYYHLLYHAQLFGPQDPSEDPDSFWQREKSRLPQFIETHPEFYAYYKSGCTHRDPVYFTRRAAAVLTLQAVTENPDDGASSSHDHLVATLLSLEKFSLFLQKNIPWP